MTILIDADGCPVVDLTLQIAKRFGISVIIPCDTSHQIEREGAQTLVFDKGSDSVDFALADGSNDVPAVIVPDILHLCFAGKVFECSFLFHRKTSVILCALLTR